MPNPKQAAEARPWADEQDAGQRAALDPRAQRGQQEQHQEPAAAQQALEAEAEEARQILDALMEYLPEGISIALGQDMRLTRVSSHGQDLLGPHAGRTVTEVLEDWRGYEPDGVTPIAIEDAPLVRAVRHGEVVEGREIWQETGYGGRIRLSCNAGPIRNAKGEITGAIVAWRDVTAEREAQDAVRRLAQFPDVNPDPVLRATPDGVLLYANEPGRRLLRSLGWLEGNQLPEPLDSLVLPALMQCSGPR